MIQRIIHQADLEAVQLSYLLLSGLPERPVHEGRGGHVPLRGLLDQVQEQDQREQGDRHLGRHRCSARPGEYFYIDIIQV